ncbi:hypothetical protein [Alloactinosynnema sp. L-07]|uniref:hypothetical protein n=1 Tax=Alloactinosynnema sp. L-07 TaxID=1653480 RepID=UPI00065F0118|nr:hypothetical protein [Alloactinosynnema sp. L-07]CRK57578.1 hypothetical protein [Alloactinosynnema sp. L-07]
MAKRVSDAMHMLLTAVRSGDIDSVSGLLKGWCGPEHPGGEDYVALVAALIGEGGRKIREAETAAVDAAFVLEVHSEGAALDIDAVDPPVRAALRAQLAWLNDDPADVDFQIRMVADHGDSDDRMTMLVNTLVWAV